LTGLPNFASLPSLVASGAIHVGYFSLLGLSYRHADYSVVYPVMRGGAPLATAFFGSVLIGEPLSSLAWLGVGLLVGGVLGLGYEAARDGRFSSRTIAIAALNVAVIVAYTLVDGLGVRLSGNAAAYVCGVMLITGLFFMPFVPSLFGGKRLGALLLRWRFGLCGGTMVMCSYGIALWAMTKAPIALVAALRETSVLFATVLAALFLKERFGPGRWLAAFAIVAGMVTLRLG
jgi:drug/metabolite transporter (DMT)-like permease